MVDDYEIDPLLPNITAVSLNAPLLDSRNSRACLEPLVTGSCAREAVAEARRRVMLFPITGPFISIRRVAVGGITPFNKYPVVEEV
jgi:hypothetical protein